MTGESAMTFCLGITVDEGLVAIADTRVVAGNECLTAKKMATYQGPGFAFFVMTSGLRSARDKILLYFEEAFAKDSASRERLYRMVNLYAQQVRRVAAEDGPALKAADLHFNAFSLVGGQMSGDSAHRLFLVYPEGNWVEIGPDTPYQIIGASGFGKPILERSRDALGLDAVRVQGGAAGLRRDAAVRRRRGFPDGRAAVFARAASTWWSSATSGRTSRAISEWWQERMRTSVQDLPAEWIEAAFSRLTRDEAVF